MDVVIHRALRNPETVFVRFRPTKAQRASVQGKSCVDCGERCAVMVADHIKPQVEEFVETGKVSPRAKEIGAVQPQCPTCSSEQGGYASWFSRVIAALLGRPNLTGRG